METERKAVVAFSVRELQNIINESLSSCLGCSAPKEIIGIDEVCKITGLSKHTIYKKTCNHEIPFYKATVAKRSPLRFLRSEIESWLLRHRIGTVDEFCEMQDDL